MQWEMFGIANHVGEPWTPQVFGSEAAAQAYLDDARMRWPSRDMLTQHSVVPVTVTVDIRKPAVVAEPETT